jgi:PUA domain protein
MAKRYNRHALKDKEAKAIIERASEKLKVRIEKICKGRPGLQVAETEFAEIFFVEDRPLLFRMGESVYPTLIFNEFLAVAPRVVVDMGAVPFVCKGANIMSPGIRRFEKEFKKGDLVLIVDEKHGKAIALGEAIFDSEEAVGLTHGVIVRNVHFVGDSVWNFIRGSMVGFNQGETQV